MAFDEREQKVYDVLEGLKIFYVRHEHPPVLTIEEAEKYWGQIKGTHCKNLFLRNKKGNRHYLVILEHRKEANIRVLEGLLKEDRLSFASAERLMRYLGLETGAVSPFGLINDSQKEVEVILDSELKKAERIAFHPNVNTATLEVDFSDFERYLSWCGNSLRYLNL